MRTFAAVHTARMGKVGVVKYKVRCAVVAISKTATLLPFGLAGSMP